MPAKHPQTLRVFIGCPGDMAPERAELLKLRDQLDHLDLPVRFLIWKNATPGAGDAQKVIFDNYPVETWDIFIGLLWTRFGVPSGFADPLSGETLTGTEAEFVAAYDAWKATGSTRPQVLLYRCMRDLPPSVDVDQLIGVRKFFKQTETGGTRPALAQDFKTVEELRDFVVRDIKTAAERLRSAAKKPAIAPGKAASVAKKAIDWPAAEASYRQHLIDSHRIVKFHTAEARAPVEVELEKVFIKLLAVPRVDLESRDRELAQIEAQLLEEDDYNRLHWMDAGADLSGSDLRWAQLRAKKEQLVFSILPGASAPQPTFLPDLLRQQNHLALSGSPGSGKSTLLQYLVLTFASQQQQTRLQLDEPRLPVLIRLRQFYRWIEQQRHDHKFHELLPAHFHEFLEQTWKKECPACELPRGFFQRLLSQPNALILLDGLDEVADPAQRRDIAALVATSLDHWREARVILTSRPKAWESEGRSALGSRVGEARICDLDDAQIAEFVHHWYLAAKLATHGDTAAARTDAETRAVDLIAAVKPERIRKLAATPLMLSILAMVHSRGVGLPQERSQLYHECIEFMLGYWDEVQGLSHDSELTEVAALARPTKRQLLEPVALWMHRLGSEQIEPLHDDLVREFARGFESVLNEKPECAKRHARAFLRLIVERGGLMQESEAGQFRFVHLTFQEYLAASAIAHGESPFAQVQPHLHDPWWREVILLAGGELSRQRSYRVKADTTAWLSGILHNHTWAEQHLLRDLQLAAQSCVDMSETGVDANLTHDLASRLIAAVMDASQGKVVADLGEIIAQFPAGHLTRAIAAASPNTPPRGKEWHLIPALALGQLLPTAAIVPPLLAAFTQASRSKDAGIAGHGAFLCVRHGPAAQRLDAWAILRRSWQDGPYGVDNFEVAKLFALGDEGLAQAVREYLHQEMTSAAPWFAAYAAKTLVQHGTPADRAFPLAHLVADLRSNNQERSFGVARRLGELRELADTPEVIAALEGILAQRKHYTIREAVDAWGAIVGARGVALDLSLVRALATDPKGIPHFEAAELVLRQGDADARAAVRAAFEARLSRANPDSALELIGFLLRADPAADRPALAARVEQLMPDVQAASPWRLRGIAVQLGETAWRCPLLLDWLLSRSAQKDREGAAALPILAELAHVRPADSSIACPSPTALAQTTLSLVQLRSTEPDHPLNAAFSRQLTSLLRTLSTFPELRTAVAGEIPPARKRKTVSRKKKVKKE